MGVSSRPEVVLFFADCCASSSVCFKVEHGSLGEMGLDRKEDRLQATLRFLIKHSCAFQFEP